MYNLVPFVSQGDTVLSVYTTNPSHDDNIFFGALFFGSSAAIVGEGVLLAPLSAVNDVGTDHTLTATVQNDLGSPIAGRTVTFEVVSGPHRGVVGYGTTDAQGKARFTYRGTSAGTDVIQARMTDSRGVLVTSNQVTKVWVAPVSTPTVTPIRAPTRIFATPSATPDFPACSVTVDKLAYPATARKDGQVGVTLRLTGSCSSEVGSAVDAALVVDRSSSMCGDKLTQAQAAGQAFLNSMSFPPDKASVISFASTAQVHTVLTGSRTQATDALYGIACGGLSRIDTGLNQSYGEMTGANRVAGHTPAIILLTDGNPEGAYAADVRAAAQRVRDTGILLYTVGLGSDVNAALLREIATQPDYYFQAPTPTDLALIYARLAGDLRDVPGANLLITDVVAPEFEIVPGSFAGAAIPQVSGDTLRWYLARMPRGETEVSFSVRPKMCDTYQVNRSATVEYDDNRGTRRSAIFPAPQVTITGCDADLADVFIRDNDIDDGRTPSTEPWWTSPDIWVRYADDGGTQHGNPQAGQRNYIYARVHNRGTQTITNIDLGFFFAAPGLGLEWPSAWSQLPATQRIISLAPGASATVSIPWDVPGIGGHRCLLVRITSEQDPIRDNRVPWENNIAQRNLHIVEYPQPSAGRCELDESGRYSDRIAFEVINTLNVATLAEVVATASGLPADATAWLVPGPLAGRWSSLDGLSPEADGRLRVTRFPATAYGIRLNPGERRTVYLEVSASGNSRFTIGLYEVVRGNLVGGNNYQRWLPPCPIRLPLIVKLFSERGTVTGQVVDATTGQPIPGATVCVLSESRCVTTDAQGRYTITNVPASQQTLRASATGYVALEQSVTVPPAGTVTVNFALSPVLAQGDIRIVLTWGLDPKDLYSHLWLPSARPYHIYYIDKGNCNSFPDACLDIDDTTSYGPETITIKRRYTGKYQYAVYLYAGSGSLATSAATVRVYGSSGLIREFTVPTSGSGRWWYVFDMDGASAAITPRNYITDVYPGPYQLDPDISAAGIEK